jgi:hypothetical protein
MLFEKLYGHRRPLPAGYALACPRLQMPSLLSDGPIDESYSQKQKTVVVGYGGDYDRCSRTASSIRVESSVSRALQRIEALVPANATFLVLPEGVIAETILTRKNESEHPTSTFMPPEGS